MWSTTAGISDVLVDLHVVTTTSHLLMFVRNINTRVVYLYYCFKIVTSCAVWSLVKGRRWGRRVVGWEGGREGGKEGEEEREGEREGGREGGETTILCSKHL